MTIRYPLYIALQFCDIGISSHLQLTPTHTLSSVALTADALIMNHTTYNYSFLILESRCGQIDCLCDRGNANTNQLQLQSQTWHQ